MVHLAVLALGSRGDAEPLLSVLARVLAGASDNGARRSGRGAATGHRARARARLHREHGRGAGG